MYTYNQVLTGISKFVDEEIIVKMSGWQKWALGTAVGIALSKSTDVFNNLKENTTIKMLNLIDKDDNIDVDTIYKNLLKEAKKSAVTFDVPLARSHNS